jgi:hypothetical protein
VGADPAPESSNWTPPPFDPGTVPCSSNATGAWLCGFGVVFAGAFGVVGMGVGGEVCGTGKLSGFRGVGGGGTAGESVTGALPACGATAAAGLLSTADSTPAGGRAWAAARFARWVFTRSTARIGARGALTTR